MNLILRRIGAMIVIRGNDWPMDTISGGSANDIYLRRWTVTMLSRRLWQRTACTGGAGEALMFGGRRRLLVPVWLRLRWRGDLLFTSVRPRRWVRDTVLWWCSGGKYFLKAVVSGGSGGKARNPPVRGHCDAGTKDINEHPYVEVPVTVRSKAEKTFTLDARSQMRRIVNKA